MLNLKIPTRGAVTHDFLAGKLCLHRPCESFWFFWSSRLLLLLGEIREGFRATHSRPLTFFCRSEQKEIQPQTALLVYCVKIITSGAEQSFECKSALWVLSIGSSSATTAKLKAITPTSNVHNTCPAFGVATTIFTLGNWLTYLFTAEPGAWLSGPGSAGLVLGGSEGAV